jgi:hypothetical protein
MVLLGLRGASNPFVLSGLRIENISGEFPKKTAVNLNFTRTSILRFSKFYTNV